VLLATAAVVALVAFSFVQRWWLAALLALPSAPVAFILVCSAFNAMGNGSPKAADFIPLGIVTAPVVIVVGIASFVIRWASSRLRLKRGQQAQ